MLGSGDYGFRSVAVVGGARRLHRPVDGRGLLAMQVTGDSLNRSRKRASSASALEGSGMLDFDESATYESRFAPPSSLAISLGQPASTFTTHRSI